MRNLKVILILFFSIVASSTYANDFFKVLNNSFSEASTMAEFEAKLNQSYEGFRIADKYKIIDGRNLDFRFKQSVYSIQIQFEKSRIQSFDIYLVTREDSIVMGKLKKQHSKQKSYFSIDENEIKNYVELHNSKYDANLSINDFKSQLSELLVYTLGCGIDGKDYSKEHQKMMKSVKNKNYNKLSEWLRQISPEIQAYAIEGLYRLQKSGIKIKPSELELIDSIKNRLPFVYGCWGCTTGEYILIDRIIERQTE